MQLVGLCGSLRKDSFNRKLMLEAVRAFDPDVFVDGNLRLPLYDGDLERAEGVPDDVQRLSDQIADADAVVVVTPEYNQSLSGVLKNALDWISRTEGTPWRYKPVALLSATAGRAGGARAQYALRLCLAPFRPLIVPGPEILVAGAAREFDATGRLVSESYQAALHEHMEILRAAATTRLRAAA